MAPLTKSIPLLAAFLAFVAWILLLLVTLSTPITKSIYLAQVDVNVHVGTPIPGISVGSAQTSLRFGVYGYCSSGVHASELGHFSQDTPAECSDKKLGYTFDSNVLNILQIDGLTDDISTALTFGLATNIVATVLSFVTLLAALAAAVVANYALTGLTLVSAVLAVIFALIAFIVDEIFASTTRRILGAANDAITVKTGNGTWMTLCAWVLLVLVAIMSCTNCFTIRRTRARSTSFPGKNPQMYQTA